MGCWPSGYEFTSELARETYTAVGSKGCMGHSGSSLAFLLRAVVGSTGSADEDLVGVAERER